MGFEEARKRRTYGRARVPRFLNPLERFSQFPAVELLGNGRSEHSQNPSEAHPLGRMEFPRFDLFLVLDLVF